MHPAFWVRSYSPQQTTHAHDWYQIVMALDGRLAMEIAGAEGAVDAQRFAIIPPGTLHRFASDHANRFVIADLPSPAAAPLLADDASLRAEAGGSPFLPMDDGVRHLSGYIASDIQRIMGDPGARRRLAGLLADALHERVGRKGRLPRALQLAIAHAEKPFREAPTVDDLARAAGVSTSSLHALFQRWLGCSPGRYILDRRLDVAEHLITRTNLPLAQIAFTVGFCDQSALTRALRRERGVTPGVLRRAAGA